MPEVELSPSLKHQIYESSQQNAARVPEDEHSPSLDRPREQEGLLRKRQRHESSQQDTARVPEDEHSPSLNRPREQEGPLRKRQRHESSQQNTTRVPEDGLSPSLERPGEQEGLLTPPPIQPNRPPKRPRPLHETIQLQQEYIKSFLHHHNSCFQDKEEASETRSWCKEVPLALQVETSKSFYQDFTNETTLPISHCVFCYRKFAPCELSTFQWKRRLTSSLLQATSILQKCKKCFPPDDNAEVDVCRECCTNLENGKVPKACSVNNMYIGCEHQYPEELDGLSPVEERLIALQAPFGYITKFTVDNKTRSGISYRKHVKGHIVVFPNKVEDLVTTVLPHPLLQAIENIHVSWSGSSKPSPTDVGNLLQVRKSCIKVALLWL